MMQAYLPEKELSCLIWLFSFLVSAILVVTKVDFNYFFYIWNK